MTSSTSKLGFKKAKTPFEGISHHDRVQEGKVNIVGFEFDGTACFRKGARLGPDSIRENWYGIEIYSPYLDEEMDEGRTIDLGNVDLGEGDIEKQWQNGTGSLCQMIDAVDLKATETRFILLGGEHSVSLGAIKSYLSQYPDLVLLHLDAHADLRDGYEGYHYSHASIIRRALDHFGDDHKLIQYGIRSGTADEFRWMNANQSIMKSREELWAALDHLNGRPIYLTLDLDFFDPSEFPGTGTPEPGGESFQFYISLIKKLRKMDLVGADVVELAPNLDSSGNSSVFACKVLRELILTMK